MKHFHNKWYLGIVWWTLVCFSSSDFLTPGIASNTTFTFLRIFTRWIENLDLIGSSLYIKWFEDHLNFSTYHLRFCKKFDFQTKKNCRLDKWLGKSSVYLPTYSMFHTFLGTDIFGTDTLGTDIFGTWLIIGVHVYWRLQATILFVRMSKFFINF